MQPQFLERVFWPGWRDGFVDLMFGHLGQAIPSGSFLSSGQLN
jgi:hypothetical protein